LIRLLFFIPIPLLIIAANYWIDPANVFHKDYEAGIVDYLLQGYNVTNIVNYDERSLQKLYIEKMPECPEEIILGSSRVMFISRELMGKDHLINNGVNGAFLEDLLAIYSLYEEKGCNTIRKVYISLDPWLLNDNHKDSRWRTLENEFNSFSSVLLEKEQTKNTDSFGMATTLYKYKELFSLSYFNSSLDYFVNNKSKTLYEPTLKEVNEGMTKRIDGSIYYDAEYRNASPEEVIRRATYSKNYEDLYFYRFPVLKEEYCSLFAKFIEHLQQQHIEVEFLLLPLHPIAYNYYTHQYPIMVEAENYYLNFAQTHHIKTTGAFNPEKYSLDNSDFFDGFHLKEEAIRKVITVK
jgi:hypothetical protein